MEIQVSKVGVIGAGQMGSGIAQIFAQYGFDCIIYDSQPDAESRARKAIEASLGRMLEKGKITEKDKEASISRISFVKELNALASAEVIIEAIIENFAEKQKLFLKLDSLCPKETIFASNTSSISITKLASSTKRADRFIGMHFFNPVPVMKLVEVIRGLQTSESTYQEVLKLSQKIERTVVTAKNDFPGFIVNRVLMPLLNEAVYVLMEGTATAEDIDTAMKLGTNHPMGPLELADFVGLDTCLYIMKVFHEEFGDSKYRPCPLLVKYVEAGYLGRKSGRGFYNYSKNQKNSI